MIGHKAGKGSLSETCGKHPKNILSELWHKKMIGRVEESWGSSHGGVWVTVTVTTKGVREERLVGHARGEDRKEAAAVAAERLLQKLAKAGVDVWC